MHIIYNYSLLIPDFLLYASAGAKSDLLYGVQLLYEARSCNTVKTKNTSPPPCRSNNILSTPHDLVFFLKPLPQKKIAQKRSVEKLDKT